MRTSLSGFWNRRIISDVETDNPTTRKNPEWKLPVRSDSHPVIPGDKIPARAKNELFVP